MPLSIVFWILMLLWLVLGFWTSWPGQRPLPYGPVGSNLLLFVLLGLLGWAVFGAAVKG